MKQQTEYVFGGMAEQKSWSLVLLFIVSCLMCFGCCKAIPPELKKADEAAGAWVTPSWSSRYDWKNLAAWRDVSDSKLVQAEILLRETNSVQVTWAQAQELIGDAGFPVFKGTPYLLRAVGDAHKRLPLELSVRPNGEVWVGGGANSKCSGPRRRQAVVAWLDKTPAQVYVTFYANTD